MLSERVCQLLSAYVDGELDAHQRQLVERLVRMSGEARAFVMDLEENAQLLRGLPRCNVQMDFSRRVLEAISDRRLPQSRRARLARSPSYPSWAGLAVAAAVLMAISLAAYLNFAVMAPGKDAANQTAERNTAPAPVVEKGPELAATPVTQEKEAPRPQIPGESERPGPSPVATVLKEKDAGSPSTAKSPEPAPQPADELAIRTPSPKMEVFEEVNQRMALMLAFRDLEQEKFRQRLREKLKKDGAYRVELSSLGNGKAFERLQEALKGQGFRILIDQTAQGRLKNSRLKTDFVLYTENLHAEDLAQILEQLAGDDRKAEAKRRGDAQFDSLTVHSLTDADHAKLSELLGVDPTQLPSPRATGPLGVDLRKPLSEATAEDVAKALKGKGTRPAPGQPAAVTSDRYVLVLAYNPVRSRPASSKEIKQFLDSRKNRGAGVHPILLVLRGANG